MFLKRFPENPLIQKIKINGRFISVYVPLDKLEAFKERYNRLGHGYGTLAIGEGVMHDYAHNSRNKHLDWLIKKSQHEHFHFILPALATPSNLEMFLNHFDADLTQLQRHEIVSGYESYISKMSMERVLECSKIYEYISAAINQQDFYVKQLMPLFNELCIRIDTYCQAVNEQEKIPSTIQLGNRTINAKKAFDTVSNFFGHIGIIIQLANKLRELQEENETCVAIIEEFNQLFEKASSMPLPDMLKLSPELSRELADNFPFIDAKISEFYLHIKEQLSERLNTSELVFTPKEAELSNYDKAIAILNNQGKIGNTIINLITRLAENQNSWNPYWRNSNAKMELIINAVLNAEKGADFASILNDKQSELYTALNMQRLLPVTILGNLGFYHAKSAIRAENELAKHNDIKDTSASII
ncbi:hypothetical protein B1207_02285 [Legionella quinlivanii]|uniref:Uncharacterized protein n=1 Tax=Legionella quinlivanii TaxID=45073 RepID=A0A364LLW6_9GAMM|nr:hypothetical protein [Legionella quinlivanii]RAP37840.1 hypothetical protein B1207_02285 [Legionella quinlivanii]